MKKVSQRSVLIYDRPYEGENTFKIPRGGMWNQIQFFRDISTQLVVHEQSSAHKCDLVMIWEDSQTLFILFKPKNTFPNSFSLCIIKMF